MNLHCKKWNCFQVETIVCLTKYRNQQTVTGDQIPKENNHTET